MNKYRNRISLWLVLLLMVTVTMGCNLTSQAPATTEAPPPPPPTNTTAPSPVPPTDTPVPPTDTPVPPTDTPVPPTDTPVPTDTPDLAATQAVEATEAAAVLFSQIDDVLEVAGMKTADGGTLAWSQSGEPVSIKVDTYGQTLYEDLDSDLKHKDFVWRVKIGWESTGGLAGCGVMFAAEDFDRGEQYRFYTLRLSGLPAWDIERWKFNDYQANVTGQVRTSATIDQKAGAVNDYLIVAKGSTITVYGNGERMGVATDTRRQEGQFAFFAFQESGVTTCTFSDSWIWILP